MASLKTPKGPRYFESHRHSQKLNLRCLGELSHRPVAVGTSGTGFVRWTLWGHQGQRAPPEVWRCWAHVAESIQEVTGARASHNPKPGKASQIPKTTCALPTNMQCTVPVFGGTRAPRDLRSMLAGGRWPLGLFMTWAVFPSVRKFPPPLFKFQEPDGTDHGLGQPTLHPGSFAFLAPSSVKVSQGFLPRPEGLCADLSQVAHNSWKDPNLGCPSSDPPRKVTNF